MKILHIIGGDVYGGAAKGALTLHKELIKLGVDSVLLKQVGNEDADQKIFSLANTSVAKFKRIILTFLDRLPLLFYPRRDKRIAFSAGYFGFDITQSVHYRDADIINLHWVNQGTFSLRTVQRIRKPIVWTIRDMWIMTGGCHHSFSCDRYRASCGKCPHLRGRFVIDLSTWIHLFKRRRLTNAIRFVAISNWLSDCARRSSLLANKRIDVIHNGIDTSEFKMLTKHIAREDLQLPIGKRILLLGASNLHDVYKGFSYFLDCVPTLLSDPRNFVVLFGHVQVRELSHLLDGRFFSFGPVRDSGLLNKIYASADIFIAPSVAEAFGKTLVEAMLSGTPVVCFSGTGASEIVTHNVSGYIARHRDARDLEQGILWCLESKRRLADLSKNAREHAENRFSSTASALKYKSLYADILKNEEDLRSGLVI